MVAALVPTLVFLVAKVLVLMLEPETGSSPHVFAAFKFVASILVGAIQLIGQILIEAILTT